MLRFPLRYIHGNILVGHGDARAALYHVDTVSYRFLSKRDKLLWFQRLAQFAYTCEGDFSIWRVNRAYSPSSYVDDSSPLFDGRFTTGETWRGHVRGHTLAAPLQTAHVPHVYLAVSLRPPRASNAVAAIVRSADQTRRRVEAIFGVDARKPLLHSEVANLLEEEERLRTRVASLLPIRPAKLTEIEWLLRRAPVRGLHDPQPEPNWRPNAIVDRAGDDATTLPLESTVARPAAAALTERERALIVETERGLSHQALLVCGALPEEAAFPGARAELLSAPLEALDFPVDVALHVRWIGNRDARARVRRHILDADDVYEQEADSCHGPTWAADENRTLARELHAYLDSEAHPPLLHASISFAVAAAASDELEARVDQLRARYGSVELHRPLGLQPALYLDHVPRPDAGAVWDYGDYVTVEQFAALMPLATQYVGATTGPYIGHTTAGSMRPVLFDTGAAARESRPPSILLAGTLGSGKTVAAQLLALQAALRGALVVDIDPKPDHNLERLEALEDSVSVIELSGDERYRGMLDPLRVAPNALREELANSFFIELLPRGPVTWETHIRRAVREAVTRSDPSSTAVLDTLARSAHADARDAGEALSVWAESGLGRLAFGDANADAISVDRQVTTIKAGALSLPAPGTARSDYTPSERLGVAVLKLVAAYALRLVSGDRSRAKLLLFDEAWLLLASSEGRRLVDRLNRLGRAENATLLLATQQLGDVGDIENLIGARFIFGQETVAEAERALALLGLDPTDRELVQRLRSYRRGRCLLRDIDDRIAEIQIDLVDPELLERLETTPAWQPALVASS